MLLREIFLILQFEQFFGVDSIIVLLGATDITNLIDHIVNTILNIMLFDAV